MMDVTVKTLDGQNRSFSVPEDMTVRQFKEKIANSINITADTQRLIFQGRVLHDEKLLKDYDVNGKVVHVVHRPPPNTNGRPGGNDSSQPSSAGGGLRDVNNVVIGSFSLPSDVLDANMVQNIAQNAIRSMGELGRNARVSTRTSADGSAVDVHIHLGPMQTGAAVSEAQMRLNTARQMMRLATEALDQLENVGSSPSAEASRPESSAQPPETQPVQESLSTPENQSASSPMETSDNEEPSNGQSGERSTDTGATQTSTESSEPASQNAGSGNQPRGPVRPNISALGEVLVDVNALNARLQPYLERFTRIVQTDGEMSESEQQENQRVCNLVSEVMHAVSHSYHALSDLMVDLSQNRPRQLYVTLAIAHPHTAVIQQTIPVQARIQVGGSPRMIRRQFEANRASQSASNSSNTSSNRGEVSVPSSAAASTPSSTTSTGTSTGPQPATAETGTQSTQAAQSSEAGSQAQASTSTFGSQHNGGLTEEEMHRLTQQMSAGLQNVFGPGMRQGDGTPGNPYVFVEMGPDSMTVNSISAEVVTSDEDGTPPAESSGTAGGQPSEGTGQPAQGAQGQQFQGQGQFQGPVPPGLPPQFFQSLVQQIVGQTGHGMPQRMQINIGQGPPPGMMGFSRQAVPMGLRFGPRVMRPAAPRNESGTQTPSGQPASSATQTSATPTSASGTQTSSTATPSSTSGTQTPGMPQAAAFVVPGIPGLAQNISPADQYLPCSSRHFLAQHARDIINQAGGPQNNTDTALADMVTNLMQGLLGGTSRAPPSGTASTTTSSTATGMTSSGSATTMSGLPRPSIARPAGPRGAFHIPGLPPGNFGMFPGGSLPFLQGMRFRVNAPRHTSSGARPAAPPMGPQPMGGAQPSTGQPATGQGQGTTGAAMSEPQYIQMLRGMLQTAQQSNQTSGSTTTSSGTPGTQSMPGTTQAISDEAFTQLVSGITNYMSQAALGQAPQQTIADFLSGLGQNYSIPQGEGFINDILSCVLSNLQITDLISVFYGSPVPLNLVQRPLREFLSTRVLNGMVPTVASVRTAVEELVESMQPEITETVNNTQPRPHIDFLATLNRFFNQQFFNIVNLVMNSREGDVNFGQDLYACVRRMLSEMFVLCSRCLGGMQNVERMVAGRMHSLTTGVNPVIQDWMSAMTSRQISTFIPTINVTEGEVAHYLTYKEVGQPSSAGQTAQTTSARASSNHATPVPSCPAAKEMATTQSGSQTLSPRVTAAPATAKRDLSPLRAPSPKRVSTIAQETQSKDEQPMEMGSPTAKSPGASEIVESHKSSPVREVKGAASASGTSKPLLEAENHPSPSGAQAVNGQTDDWHAVLPPEWVPVVTRDIEKQRNMPPQRPHSDVYLQGMPPKRRKLMTQDRPGDLSNTEEVLPESIRRAVAAAAVEPISSLENLSSELNSDLELHETFDAELNNTLNERLKEDKDFKPECFPNTDDYFHKTDGKKQ